MYVDAHGMPVEGNDSGERGKDEGWKLAKADDGKQAELVRDDWIADTLKQVRLSEIGLVEQQILNDF